MDIPRGHTEDLCSWTQMKSRAESIVGAAALVQSKYLNWTPQQVKDRLRASIVLLPDTSIPGRIDVVLATQ